LAQKRKSKRVLKKKRNKTKKAGKRRGGRALGGKKGTCSIEKKERKTR